MHPYALQEEDGRAQIEELLRAMATPAAKNEYKAPLTMGFQILDYSLENGKLLINMDEKYKELNNIQEVLVRAAIVRTLTAHPDVNFVAIRVNNEQLYDSLGNLVGWMNADQFIENDGKEINTYEEVKLKLYFANETGDMLIPITRTKEYNTNISLEKLIVEELIKGPNGENIYPTINPATKVANVTVKDGVCYVNLDENFLSQIYTVSPEVTIFSITNSLVELSNVNKVQISINGDTSGVYREKYSFTTYFERNLDLVQK
jgi:germination protein M